MLNIYALEGKHDHKLTPVTDALREQEWLLKNKTAEINPDPDSHIFFTEHLPVYTFVPYAYKCTRIFRESITAETLPAPLVPIKRPGSITFHGPGQLVYYLILNLDSLCVGITTLSQSIDAVIIETLRQFGINAHQKPIHLPEAGSGVWVTMRDGTQKKIASRGMDKRGKNPAITQFGFALNVSTDLSYFNYIYPCGLDIEMTSMKEILGGTVLPLQEVAKSINAIISTRFEQTKRHPQ